MQYICVYCASSNPQDADLVKITAELGQSIAKSGYGLVYGGAGVGLMGVLAQAVMEAGAPVCGVFPRLLSKRELNTLVLTEMHQVDTMAERKQMMAEKASAFVALPGGIGTMDELCECLSWSSLGIHRKPVVIYNVKGYYDKLLAFFDDTVAMGFMPADFRQSIVTAQNPEELFQAISAYQAPPLPDWM
ncbi:MAG: TIGR00730 family Rossman fold protein [bacterium]|nr:TIGR00730 family Rossman fold protein [bacterium]